MDPISGYEESAAGLGYDESEGANDNIDSTVKKYLEICLQYHQSRVDNDTSSPSDIFNHGFVQPKNDESTPSMMNPNANISLHESLYSQTSLDREVDDPKLDEVQHQMLQTAVEKAQSIARSFMNNHSNKLTSNSISVHDRHTPFTSHDISKEYSSKRKEFLESFARKLHGYFVKNLEYLAKKDEERYMNHLQMIEQNNTDQEKLLAAQTQRQNKRQNFLSTHVSGIGTRIRQQMENKKRKIQGLSIGSNHEGKKQINGLYISGLPMSDTFQLGEHTSSTSQNLEDFIRELFGSYGKIQRVTFYEDRKTGRRKGDGLVVYDDEDALCQNDLAEPSENSFLKAICSQLNGAEMPWGATLSVELASTDYNKKKRTEDSTSTTAISCLSRTMISDGTDDGETILDPKDDLETFFSELEQE